MTRLPIRFAVLLSALTLLIPSTVIASGAAHSVIVKSDGTVWAVGANTQGQIGDNTNTTRPTFVQVPGLSNVVKVAAGGHHSMAVTSAGALYVWGDNAFGQVGDGSTIDRKVPVLLSLTGVVAVAAGEYHSVALKSNGDSYAWGKNVNGQLGRGNTTQANAPVLILKKVSAIGAGFNHTLFIKTVGGTAWAAGLNTDGQLGDSTTTQRTSPVQMTGVSNATAISGGERHSVALLSGGTLVATGYNGDGALGDGTTTARTSAVAVVSLTGVSAISSGAGHVVARKSDNTLRTWGRNHRGQLADGTITNRPTPQLVAGLPASATILAGDHNSFAVTSSGIVYSWGDNATFQLGDGTTVDSWTPVQISDVAFAWRVATPTVSISSGTYTANQTVIVADATAGSVIHYTQNGVDPTEADPVIASGGSLVISSSLTLKVKAWKTGVLPSAVTTAIYVLKVPTPTFTPAAGSYTAAQNVTIATATTGATLRYTLDGTDPTGTSPLYGAPVNVATSATLKAVAFKAGWANSDVGAAAYAMNFGTLAAPTVAPATGTYASSASVTMSSGQPGATVRYTSDNTAPTISSTPYTAPVSITVTTTVRAKAFHPDYTPSAETLRTYTITALMPTIDVASGAYESGSMVTVSTTESGATLRMTLDGTDPTASSPSIASGTSLFIGAFTLKARAFRAGAQDSAVAAATYTLNSPMGSGAIAAGSQHSLLATSDGRVYSWGANASSQLGDGGTTSRLTPTVLHTMTGVTQVAAGVAHSLARVWNGQVYAWGNNGLGRLGDGTTTLRPQPVLVPTLANIVAVAAGDAHSLALASDGRVYAWGGNANGQLGLGSTTNTSVPTEITAIANVVAIAAGSSHSLAVTASGQMYAWGLNTNSRLGDGTSTQRLAPVLLSLTNVISVAAGASHSAALTADGKVYTWGLGSSGQLGLGSTTTMTTPTLVPTVQASAIAAGDDVTVAVRHDGVLVAWGGNTSGQIGDTTTQMRTSATVVAGPASVSSIALGDAHALAVTPDGALWTWGHGGSGRLGDNATAIRPTPQSVATGLASWRLAAPTLSVPSSTLNATQDVAVVSSTTGADIRYTLTGVAPTQADAPVPANGLVSITASSMLRAKAFLAGRLPSIEARADYFMQSATPTIDPPTGIYQLAQTVTIASSDPTATIRYTVDGTDPTPTSTIYTASFAVSTTQTIKARGYPTDGFAPSAVNASTLTFGLAPPTASPAGGIFLSPPSVTLSSIAGAAIRYTLDGSNPTISSPLYTAPIAIFSVGATLKSVAFHPDWPASSIRSDVYMVDAVAPSIVGARLPSAFNGWHLTPVMITFVCWDDIAVASCTSPTNFSVEGTGQAVTGTAIDAAGRQTTSTQTFNVDLTPPIVMLTSPADGFVTTSDTVTVTGSASDALSGLNSVTCNGVTTSVVNGLVSCSVALRPGVNTVALSALDVAGHSASVAIRISRVGTTPSALTLTPNVRTMVVGEQMPLALRDAFGAVVLGAAWSSTNPSVLSLSPDDPPILSALAQGNVVVSASKDGFGASSSITVSASALPDGQLRWSADTPSAPNQLIESPIHGYPVESTEPEVFTVAMDTVTGARTVRPVTVATGEAHSMIAAPGRPLLGDTFGGLLAGVEPTAASCSGLLHYTMPEQKCYKALVRFAGPTSATSWRYQSRGVLDRPAQGPDGTIYVMEHVEHNGANFDHRSIVILDGATGAVKNRLPLANSYSWETSNGICKNSYFEFAPLTLGPIVAGDGAGYVLVSHIREKRDWTCSQEFPIEIVSETNDIGFRLLRISSDGDASETMLDDSHYVGDWSWTDPRQLLPDGIDGLLIVADHWVGSGRQRRVTRLDGEGARTDIALDSGTKIELIGQNGTAYLHRINASTSPPTSLGKDAVDVRNWQTNFTLPVDWSWLSADPDGGAKAENTNTQLGSFDGAGQLTSTSAPTGVTNPVQLYGHLVGHSSVGVRAVSMFFEDGTYWDATQRPSSPSTEGPRRNGNRLNQSAGPLTFTTVQQAAVERLRFYNGRSIALDREFGGSICRNPQQRYIATFSGPSQPPSSHFVFPTGCETLLGLSGLELAGRYHTHGKFGDVGLSWLGPNGGDVGNAHDNPTIPWFVASPCGGIYEYSAFTTPRPWYRWKTSPSDLIPIYGKPLPQRATGRGSCPVDVGIAVLP